TCLGQSREEEEDEEEQEEQGPAWKKLLQNQVRRTTPDSVGASTPEEKIIPLLRHRAQTSLVENGQERNLDNSSVYCG
ncbi:hypothetical protein ATANTOWER_029386, partial [Ataeniobius toweri]|nr:hypothetical protein [Ataeniobius toweri]